tara:strand:- start:59 stop:355 length:297 start_codon:yes stop_codon:yes gene_type:complete
MARFCCCGVLRAAARASGALRCFCGRDGGGTPPAVVASRGALAVVASRVNLAAELPKPGAMAGGGLLGGRKRIGTDPPPPPSVEGRCMNGSQRVNAFG